MTLLSIKRFLCVGADVFAGTGLRCHGWELSCGDGDAALDARLMAPKGIAVGPGGTVYVADGKVSCPAAELFLCCTISTAQSTYECLL